MHVSETQKATKRNKIGGSSFVMRSLRGGLDDCVWRFSVEDDVGRAARPLPASYAGACLE